MKLARQVHDEIVAHARAEAPNECCGVVAGRNGSIVSAHRARNVHASPVRYEYDPRELYELNERMDRTGEEHVGYYHSHVKVAARPSETDINWGRNWPEFLYVICSLANADRPDLRGFRIAADGEVEEVELELEEA